jgi:DNA-binding GntR family transcriptional regulator
VVTKAVTLRPERDARLSQAERAYRVVKRAVVRCELDPGSQVTKAQLCERFGISDMPARVAIERLVQERFLQAIPQTGYLVAPVTLKQIHDLLDLRLVLETAAARRSAGRIEEPELRRLGQLCREHYRPDDFESLERYLDENTDFHVSIARASGNDRLADMVALLFEEMERIMYLAHRLSDANQSAETHHADLVRALAAADPEAAAAAVATEIQSMRSDILDEFIMSRGLEPFTVQLRRSET